MTKHSSYPRLERMTEADGRTDFSTSSPALNTFFAKHAFPNSTRGIGRTYVLRPDPADLGSPAILGFFTVSMAAIESDELSDVERGRLPRYPMPVALIGRLAVDERARGKRYGERLLVEALRLILTAAETVGCLGVIVDAKDKAACGFYEKYGFVALGTNEKFPSRMYMPLETARAALA